MILSLIITGAPYSSQAPYSAYQFAQAALQSGHSIHRIFLQGDGVLCANALSQPPQDESNIVTLWQTLADQQQWDIVVCIASALKRGVLDKDEAERYNKQHHNLSPNMAISGLGQLMDAIHYSDRVITFAE